SGRLYVDVAWHCGAARHCGRIYQCRCQNTAAEDLFSVKSRQPGFWIHKIAGNRDVSGAPIAAIHISLKRFDMDVASVIGVDARPADVDTAEGGDTYVAVA